MHEDPSDSSPVLFPSHCFEADGAGGRQLRDGDPAWQPQGRRDPGPDSPALPPHQLAWREAAHRWREQDGLRHGRVQEGPLRRDLRGDDQHAPEGR